MNEIEQIIEFVVKRRDRYKVNALKRRDISSARAAKEDDDILKFIKTLKKGGDDL